MTHFKGKLHLDMPRARSLEELQAQVQQQFLTIMDYLGETLAVDLRLAHVEPDKPRDGMLVVADGSNWDPGNGRGVYFYDSAWKFLLGTKTTVWTVQTTDFTFDVADSGQGFVVDSASDREITLPAATGVGTYFFVVRKGAGKLTLRAEGSSTINGGTTVELGRHVLRRVECVRNSGGSAAEWYTGADQWT